MKNEFYFYKLEPLIAEVGKETEVRVRPLQPRYRFDENIKYSVKIYPMTRNERNMVALPEYSHEAKVAGYDLVFRYVFDKEEEYVIKIYSEEQAAKVARTVVEVFGFPNTNKPIRIAPFP